MLESVTELSALQTTIRYVEASRFLTYATFCLLIYDHALTLADEIHLVWRSRSINLVKLLFIFNRYAVPVCLAVDCALLSGIPSGLNHSVCHGWFIFDIIMEMLSLYSTTLIITLRVRALWADRDDIYILLLTVWITQVLGTTGLLTYSLVKNQGSYTYEPSLSICFGEAKSTWLIWLPSMVFHAVIFGLLILKCLYTPRDEHTLLLTILLVDGFIFFAVVFGAMLANMLIWALATPSLVQLPHYSVWAISNIAITRLLLSLQARFHAHNQQKNQQQTQSQNRPKRSEAGALDHIRLKETTTTRTSLRPFYTSAQDPFYSQYHMQNELNTKRHQRQQQQPVVVDIYRPRWTTSPTFMNHPPLLP